MPDQFFFSGVENDWFSNCFEAFHLLGYIGDRERLTAFQQKKSFAWRVIEIVAPRVKISSLIKLVSGFDLSILTGAKTDEANAIATKIINLLKRTEA